MECTEQRYQEIKNDKTNHKKEVEEIVRKRKEESDTASKKINKLGNELLKAL